MNEEIRKIKIRRIKKMIAGAVAFVIIASIIFITFKISTDAHHVFREAKNVKLALRMLDIEYYGQGRSIYDPTQRNGMTKGVMERVSQILENDGTVVLTGYDTTQRQVTDFVYTIGRYQVIYCINKAKKDDYQVNFILPVYHYDGKE